MIKIKITTPEIKVEIEREYINIDHTEINSILRQAIIDTVEASMKLKEQK